MSHAPEMLQATREGNAPGVARLLSQDPGLVHATDEHLKTPLHWAAEHNHPTIAAMLLDAGAAVEARTSWGATPLDWAATMGSIDVADVLLAHGAQGMNLVMAASLGKLDVVRAFLDSGSPRSSMARRAVPQAPNEHWGADSACMKGDVLSDAFCGACRNGHTEVAALLLERGAGVDAKGVFGGTALHWAALNGHRDTVAFLVAHGADRGIRDSKFASTPEEWATEGGHDEIHAMLRRP